MADKHAIQDSGRRRSRGEMLEIGGPEQEIFNFEFKRSIE